jgi:anaerobic magnesium-protoporphyrin IX monomethyl ester cyclase
VILLAHSNFLAQDPKQTARMKPYAPLSTMLAAALLRQAGHDVALFDATFADGSGAFEAMLDAQRPKVVVVMEDHFNFLTKMCTPTRRESALAMIRSARRRGARVAANGPDVSDNPAMYLAAGADAVVLGEGELAVLEVVTHWCAGGIDMAGLPGLVLPGNGALLRTAPRRALHDLDRLPPPAWDLVDVAAYRTAWQGAHERFSWSAVASRGCPYSCNWCAKPSFGRRYTARSPANLVAELSRLRHEVAPDHLWFADDIFGLDIDWTARFSEAVIAAGAVIPFTMQSRVNLMTERSVAALAAAGAEEVWLGIESGAQSILDAMDKGTTVAAARTATRLLKAHGVKACWFIQLGYPGESWDDIIATRDLIRDEAPDAIGVSVSYPLPGTEFYDRVRSQLGRQRNWRDTGELAMLFQGTYDTQVYRQLRDLLHAEADHGRHDDAAWRDLATEAETRRSPQPSELAQRA